MKILNYDSNIMIYTIDVNINLRAECINIDSIQALCADVDNNCDKLDMRVDIANN